jgi:YgiT-type zinc finger domain-containing protein
MTCDFCGGKTVSRRVKKHHWYKGRLYFVENVPAEVCRECGERYFHADTLDRIDEFLKKEHPVKDRIKVEVVALTA